MAETDRPMWVEALHGLRGEAYRVWAYLYWRQGTNEQSWPAQTTIATDMGLTVQGVRNITRRLEHQGWLRINRGAGPGRGHVTTYVVTTLTQKVNDGLPMSQAKRSTPVEVSDERKGQPSKREKVNGESAKRSTAEARLYKEEHKQGTHTKEHKQRLAVSQGGLVLLAQLRESLQPQDNAGHKAISNVVEWACSRGPEAIDRVRRIANECRQGTSPARLWMHRIKYELGYTPRSNGKPRPRLRHAEPTSIGAAVGDYVRGIRRGAGHDHLPTQQRVRAQEARQPSTLTADRPRARRAGVSVLHENSSFSM